MKNFKISRSINVFILVVLLLSFSAFQACSQKQVSKVNNNDPPVMPTGIKGERIKALIETVNSNDPDRVREFLSKHCTGRFANGLPMSQHLNVMKSLHRDSGGMTFKGIANSDSGMPNQITVVTKGNSSGYWAVSLFFDETDESRFGGIMFRPIPKPSGL